MSDATTPSFPMAAGTTLTKGVKYFSVGGGHYLCHQDDGNVVVKTAPPAGADEGTYVWSVTGNAATAATYRAAEFDTQGNLIARDASGTSIPLAGTVAWEGATLWLTAAGVLQILAPGGAVLWSSTGDLTPDAAAPKDGWATRRLMADPKITIVASAKVSAGAVDAVERIYTRIAGDLQAGYARSKLDGYVVYITNTEPWDDQKVLAPIATMWPATPYDRSGEELQGGTTPNYLWITEDMIGKSGVGTRTKAFDEQRRTTDDTTYRSYDQVVHEFAHAIDYRFGLRERIVALYENVPASTDTASATVREPDNDPPEEEFAWGVQRWYGAGGTFGEDPTSLLTEVFGTTVFSDGSAFEQGTGKVVAKPAAS